MKHGVYTDCRNKMSRKKKAMSNNESKESILCNAQLVWSL